MGENYARNCEHARMLNRRDGLSDMHELLHAHTLLVGVIGSMLEQHNGRRVPVKDEGISRKFVLTAAFVQGISLCKQSILQGLYLQAGNLIRQEYETLALLNEIKAGKRKDDKVANAKYAPGKGSKHYGQLSAYAHLSKHQILDSIIGYNTAWGDFASTTPRYQKENAERLFSFHTSMVFGLVEELQTLYAEMYGYKSDERESSVVDVVFSILVKYKIFKRPQEK